jgi:hypothetical protein
MSIDYRRLLLDMFQAAVNAAAPALCVPAHLPPRPKGRTVVVGAGKAAASMAAAVEAHWNGAIEGLVVTRYGHGVPCRHIEVVEAAHPVPDEAGSRAARRILDKVSGLTADDLVLALISGGGSALLALPPHGIALGDKQAINRALLKCGADIGEINTVRKHLSAIKGGRLAVAAAPAQMVTLAISDVPGDDISVIASGPAAPDASTRADALAVLTKYGIAIPAAVAGHLDNVVSETPKPGDPRLQFLAPSANTRTDEYGGSIANRARFAIEVATAIAEEIGADRTAIRLSPGITMWGIDEGAEGPALHRYLVAELERLGLAYLHIMHTGDEQLLGDIRARWKSSLILNRPGRPRDQIGADIVSGLADQEAYGQMVLANPDFVARLKTAAPMNTADRARFFGGAAQGYIDYPALEAAAAA